MEAGTKRRYWPTQYLIRTTLGKKPLVQHQRSKILFLTELPVSNHYVHEILDQICSLNQATVYESPTHSSIGMQLKITLSSIPHTAWELMVICSMSLPDGVLFTFHSHYYLSVSHPRLFDLARWSLLIHLYAQVVN